MACMTPPTAPPPSPPPPSTSPRNDDQPPSQPVSRRSVLRAAGGVGLASAAALAWRPGSGGTSAASDTGAATRRAATTGAATTGVDSGVAAALRDGAVCMLTPESDRGPFYLAGELVRKDIREGKPGVPLHLRLHVMDAKTCAPLPDVALDIWHCDAVGTYSGVARRAEGEQTDDSSTFLRGPQPTTDRIRSLAIQALQAAGAPVT